MVTEKKEKGAFDFLTETPRQDTDAKKRTFPPKKGKTVSVIFKIPKDERDFFKTFFKKSGRSLQGGILTAMEEFFENHKNEVPMD